MIKIVISCVICGLIGVLLGYTGAYVEFRNECAHGAQYSEWECEWVGIPALPGVLMAASLREYDSQMTEAWVLDRHRIALFNGLFYLPLGLPLGLAVLIRKKVLNKRA